MFLTSHIIQDMERLIDDCIMMDYGRILRQCPITEITQGFHRYTCTMPERLTELPAAVLADKELYHPALSLRGDLELYSFLSPAEVEARLQALQLPHGPLQQEALDLEDAFIGLTGKY